MTSEEGSEDKKTKEDRKMECEMRGSKRHKDKQVKWQMQKRVIFLSIWQPELEYGSEFGFTLDSSDSVLDQLL